MVINETALILELIEKNEPIKDFKLNSQLIFRGVDPCAAIVSKDILENQGRIQYDYDTHCYSLSESESRFNRLSKRS